LRTLTQHSCCYTAVMGPDHAVIEALRGALAGRQDVRLALLFGSRARGRARPGADGDVAVLAPEADLEALAAHLSLAAGVDVEVSHLDSLNARKLRAVTRDGILLHAAEPGLLGAWRATVATSGATSGATSAG
jgi:predicted nucleotidyltransferase